jgi:predicted kinase
MSGVPGSGKTTIAGHAASTYGAVATVLQVDMRRPLADVLPEVDSYLKK